MKQELIVKSNKLLQHPLYRTSLELKLFSRIVLAVRNNPEEDVFTFQIKELLEKIECNKNDYVMIKKVANSMDRRVDINEDTDNIFSDTVHIFRRITISKQGVIIFTIEEYIKPYILDLTTNFTQYYFENIARLKSSYSIRLYEFLKQYEKIGKRKTSVIELRHFLNIDDCKYKYIKDFRKYTILVAQKELKEKTDIYFEFEEIKTGRKITDFTFIIFKNNESKNINEKVIESKLPSEQEDIKNILTSEYGVSEKVAFDVISNVNIKQIKDNITYTKKEFEKNKVNKNFAGFLLNSIKNNYAGNLSLFEETEKKKKNEEKKEAYLIKKKNNLTEDLSREFSKTEKIRFIGSLTDEQQKSLLDEILEENKEDGFIASTIRKGGLSSPLAHREITKRIENFIDKKEIFIKKGLKEAGF